MSLVSVRRCPDYKQERIDRVISACLADVKAEELFQPGDTVLLKANILGARQPEEAVTTHPEIIAALARWFLRRGAKVLVGDSSGGVARSGARGNTDRAMEISGIAAAATGAGATLVNFDAGTSTFVFGGLEWEKVLVAQPVLDADLVVSVPKLKTHGLTLMTAGIKNMFGIVPGAVKAQCHRIAPGIDQFCQGLVDVFAASGTNLTVLDAVEAMEGEGPSAGRVIRRELVLASRDTVALDAAACHLAGCSPGRVRTTVFAAQRGLGNMDFQLSGDEVEVMPFKLPLTGMTGPLSARVSGPFFALLRHLPDIDRETCVNCNLCVTSCPVDALVAGNPTPGLRAAKCIHCYCCHELCPHRAIELVPVNPRLVSVVDWVRNRRRTRR